MTDTAPAPVHNHTDPAAPTRARRRRLWPKILIAVAIVVVLALVAGLLYAFSIDRQVMSNINRGVDMPSEDSRPAKEAQEVGTLNYVLLGSDSRDPGDEGNGRSDSIMLVHLNKARDEAYIISFPRDMYVNVPGHGKNKINAAFAFGGPPLTIRTLEKLTDVRVDHVAIVDFEGFIKLTDDLGGVTVSNKTAFTSHGFDYPKGSITIQGEEALWFVRERHALPRGDLDRAENQRKVIRAIVRKGLSAEVIADPARFTAFVGNVASHLTVDNGLLNSEIRSTALSLRLSGRDIHLLQAPISGFGTTPDGQSIDVVDEAKMKALAKALKSDDVAAYVKKYPDN